MQSNHSSRPNTGTRPSTSAPQAISNLKLQTALETHGSFANALATVTSTDFADKLVQVWSVFYDRCRFLDSRISPTGNLSWTEVKGVINFLHIQKLTTERCLRNLFSDLGTLTFLVPEPYLKIHLVTDNVSGFSFKDADNVVQVNYVAFVDEIKRSIGQRPSSAFPHGIKSGWSAERPRGKCQVQFSKHS
jgi:hypothetical protein